MASEIPMAGAVDLSALKEGGVGPREAEALFEELQMMAQTRELALRDRVRYAAENEGLNRALAALTYLHGTDDGNGKRFITIDHDAYHDAMERIVAVSIDPGSEHLHLVVTVAQDGDWVVSADEPTDEQKQTLPIFEELPEVSVRPDAWDAIVSTEDGLRIATWTPEVTPDGS